MPYVKLDMGRYIEGKPQPEGYFDALAHEQIAYRNGIEKGEWENKLGELFNYLVHGTLPKGVRCKKPKMSAAQAKDVLWFLSVVTRLIPDNFYVCDICGEVSNDDYGRYFGINGKFYCEGCLDYAPVCRCGDCGGEMRINNNLPYDDRFYCRECRKKHKEKNKEHGK